MLPEIGNLTAKTPKSKPHMVKVKAKKTSPAEGVREDKKEKKKEQENRKEEQEREQGRWWRLEASRLAFHGQMCSHNLHHQRGERNTGSDWEVVPVWQCSRCVAEVVEIVILSPRKPPQIIFLKSVTNPDQNYPSPPGNTAPAMRHSGSIRW